MAWSTPDLPRLYDLLLRSAFLSDMARMVPVSKHGAGTLAMCADRAGLCLQDWQLNGGCGAVVLAQVRLRDLEELYWVLYCTY